LKFNSADISAGRRAMGLADFSDYDLDIYVPVIKPYRHNVSTYYYPLFDNRLCEDQNNVVTRMSFEVQNIAAIHSIYQMGSSTIYENNKGRGMFPKSVGLHGDAPEQKFNMNATLKQTLIRDHLFIEGGETQSTMYFSGNVRSFKSDSEIVRAIQCLTNTTSETTPSIFPKDPKVANLKRSALPDPNGYPFSKPGTILLRGIKAMIESAMN
jgi:hypothetical protein